MLDQASIHNWIVKNKILTEDGKPLDFFNHLFLFDIAKDFSPKQVIYKCSQVGGSLINVIKVIYLMKQKGYNGIYSLPTQTDARDFVNGKVNRLVANNDIFKEYVKDQDSIEQKRIGDNVLYFRGSFTEKAAIMIPSDVNVYDEEDRSNLAVIDTYASRLKHSDYKGEWHFSNPSVLGHGVSRYWSRSDQKEWFVVCPICKDEQYLKWPDNVCMERGVFQCSKCHAELPDEARRIGRWVKKFKDKEFSGYHVSHLMAPWMTAKEIISDFENKPADYFYNFVLGLPYVSEDSTVSPDMIFRNCTDDINSQEQVVIGCDSGIKKHYVMGNKEGIFRYGVTEDWEDIERLLHEYEDAILVVDAMPDITGPRLLRQKFPGRVFLCHYARDRKTMQLVRWGTNKEAGSVLVDRNRMIQLVVDEFNQRRIPLNGKPRDFDEYYSHWETMYRQEDTDALGMPVFIWESSNGVDHYAHASIYWRAGMTRQRGGGVVTGSAGLDGIPEVPIIGYDRTHGIPKPRKKPKDWRAV